jgi:hypothetical protein
MKRLPYKRVINCINDAELEHAGKYFGVNKSKKSKVVPLRSIQELLGERRYSSYSSLTSALEGGEWSASRPGRASPPGVRAPRYPLYTSMKIGE